MCQEGVAHVDDLHVPYPLSRLEGACGDVPAVVVVPGDEVGHGNACAALQPRDRAEMHNLRVNFVPPRARVYVAQVGAVPFRSREHFPHLPLQAVGGNHQPARTEAIPDVSQLGAVSRRPPAVLLARGALDTAS